MPAALLFLIGLSSCNPSSDSSTVVPAEMAETFEDEGKEYFISKRSRTDLVRQLYAEQVENDPELKALEEALEDLEEREGDSTEGFKRFEEKNREYYQLADNYAEAIRDSGLRKSIQDQLSRSSVAYERQVSTHRQLMDRIGRQKIALSDLHTLLKLVRTLPLLEQYQKAGMTSLEPLEGISAAYGRMIRRTDSMARK